MNFLVRLARRLQFVKPLAYGMGMASFGLLLYLVFVLESATRENYVIPVTLAMIWSLLVGVLVTLFPNMPGPADSSDSLVHRIKRGVARIFFYGLAVVFVVTTFVVLLLSLKMIGIWQTDL